MKHHWWTDGIDVVHCPFCIVLLDFWQTWHKCFGHISAKPDNQPDHLTHSGVTSLELSAMLCSIHK